MKFDKITHRSDTILHVLICLFAMGSWIAVNGLWVELPVLVEKLPERWNLPSYMVVIVQLANIGPLVFIVTNQFCGRNKVDKPAVYIIVITGVLSCLLLAFFWDKTSLIGGREHSTAFLVLHFFLSLIDCTSSVVFYSFMANFEAKYLTTFFIGEGFSGLFPGLLVLVQGVGDVTCVNQSHTNSSLVNDSLVNRTTYATVPEYHSPRFMPRDFFIFLFWMMLLCGIAFVLLNYLLQCRKQQIPPHLTKMHNSDTNCSEEISKNQTNKTGLKNIEEEPLIAIHNLKTTKMSKLTYAYLLALTTWINALSNGVLTSVQSYACLPYGSQTYHLAVTLSSFANPLACSIAFLRPMKSKTIIGVLVMIACCIALYIVVIAAFSPDPPLKEEVIGSVLIVLSWILVSGLHSFSKMSVASLLRSEGRNALLFCGAATQGGSTVGAVLMFVIVNIYKLFTAAPTCPQ